MNKEDLITILKELESCKDAEYAHGTADRFLIKYINDPEIAEAYENIERWYA